MDSTFQVYDIPQHITPQFITTLAKQYNDVAREGNHRSQDPATCAKDYLKFVLTTEDPFFS